MTTKMIYLDMDGVLADLNTGLRNNFPNIDPAVFESDRNKLFKSYLPAHVRADGFYTQPVLTGAVALVSGLMDMYKENIINLAILTSAGHFFNPISEVIHQKKRFLELNLPELNRIPFCVTTSGKDKAQLAHAGAFLVDDHTKNVENFILHGGKGYVYSPEKVDECLVAVYDFVQS